MKAKMMVMATLVTVLLAAGACSPAVGASPAEASVDVSIDEFTSNPHIAKAIEIPVDGVLTVSLGSNPTTGFSWNETAQIAAAAVLEQTDSSVLPSEKEGLVGAAGSQVWTFKALQKGTTTVNLEYGRPWEGGEKGVWTFELTVTVK